MRGSGRSHRMVASAMRGLTKRTRGARTSGRARCSSSLQTMHPLKFQRMPRRPSWAAMSEMARKSRRVSSSRWARHEGRGLAVRVWRGFDQRA